jgi:hypothetical protein
LSLLNWILRILPVEIVCGRTTESNPLGDFNWGRAIGMPEQDEDFVANSLQGKGD